MRRILTILSSDDFRMALESALMPHFDVISCRDVSAGENMLKHHPDALILDLFLPDINGISFLKKTISLHPTVILMLTPLIDSDILQAANDAGVDYVIRKPCPASAIIIKLKEHL